MENLAKKQIKQIIREGNRLTKIVVDSRISKEYMPHCEYKLQLFIDSVYEKLLPIGKENIAHQITDYFDIQCEKEIAEFYSSKVRIHNAKLMVAQKNR